MNPEPHPLAKFPPEIRDAHDRWLAHHDDHALDRVVLSIVAHHLPSRIPHDDLTQPPDSARLIQDLGYDSLAIAEVVFFIEDLYGVTVTNQDLQGLHTIAQLRSFVRTKVSAPCPTSQPAS